MNITNYNNNYKPSFGYYFFTESAINYLNKLGKGGKFRNKPSIGEKRWEKFDQLRKAAKSCEHCVYVDVSRGRLDAEIRAYGVAYKPIGYRRQKWWESQLHFLERMHKLSIKNGKKYDQRQAEKKRLRKLQRERFPISA